MSDTRHDDLGREGHHLHLPSGWVLDEAARTRLADLLDGAVEQVVGVVARWSPLPPGSSHRVFNEHLALQAEHDFTVAQEVRAPAAVLTRDPERVTWDETSIRVTDGVLLVAHGVRAHDPAAPVESLAPAVSLGRSPFPWRPLVALVGFAPDPEVGRWAAGLTDELLDHGIEARLAVDAHWGDRHLTGPCLPCTETLTALAPDVIVALDDRAEQLARSYAAPSGWTTVMRVEGDGDRFELVPWNEHPRRARAGRGTPVADLADGIRTLCAEPHPLSGPAAAGTAVASPSVGRNRRPEPDRRLPSRRRTVHLMVGGVLAPPGRSQLTGLAEFVTLVGDRVRTIELHPDAPDDGDPPDIALVSAGGRVPPAPAVNRREDALGGSAALVTPDDVRVDPDGHGELATSALDTAGGIGRAVATGRGTADLLRAAGVPTFELPWLVDRNRRDALRRAGRSSTGGSGPPTLGWSTGLADHPAPTWAQHAATAVVQLLDALPDLRVEVVGDPMTLPVPLLQHPRVVPLPSPAHPTDLARWWAHVWSPSPGQVEVLGMIGPFVECSLASVPSVIDGRTAAHLGHHQALGACTVDDPSISAWWDPLHRLLTDRTARAWQVRRTDDVVAPTHDRGACAATVTRMLDWVETTP